VKDHQLIPWTQPGWFGRVSAQVHAELQRPGITVSGPIEQPHSYPWSTVLRVPTGEGNVLFKAVSPAHPHEPALIEALARWSPDQVPRLLSVDTERGWILMRDAGRRLRELVRPTRDMRPWLPVLPRYAELQIELSRRVPDLLALGVPDRRLQVLPTLYEPLLADVDVLRVDQPPGLTRGRYERLLYLAPRVAEPGGRLAEYRIPETLNHGHLPDCNALVDDGSPVFTDTGATPASRTRSTPCARS
jgi:hypothetical protein